MKDFKCTRDDASLNVKIMRNYKAIYKHRALILITEREGFGVL